MWKKKILSDLPEAQEAQEAKEAQEASETIALEDEPAPGEYFVLQNIKRDWTLYKQGDKVSFDELNDEVKSLISNGIIK